jgi:hypothetical protein
VKYEGAVGNTPHPPSPRKGTAKIHSGKLSCFLPGISTVFPRSIASALAIRGRVTCGMITSSIAALGGAA